MSPLVTHGSPRTTTTAPRPGRGWAWVRAALLAAWLLIGGTAYAMSTRSGTLADAYAAAAAGRLSVVQVSGALASGAVGYGTETLRWRDGHLTRQATVLVSSPGFDVPASAVGERTTDDVVVELKHRDPGLRVTSTISGMSTQRSGRFGWILPPWLAGLAFFTSLSTLALLIGGPQPWRATRWAWFWLAVPPFGQVAYLLLSGPTRGLADRADPSRRLTGGKAGLISLVLAASFSAWRW